MVFIKIIPGESLMSSQLTQKVHGFSQSSMSNILNELDSDEQSIRWWHLAACNGMDTNLFFDKYESDLNMAKAIDQCCISCPVMSICFKSGIENSEYGVWGGVFLSAGLVDKMKNVHKTKDIWKQLKAKQNV